MFHYERNTSFYNLSLGINGTIDQLLNWCYRYDRAYSDEALEKISEIAQGADWLSKERKMIPLLVLRARQREEKGDGTLPYEQMKLNYIIDGAICFSETKDYGKVEIRTEGENVLISVQWSENGRDYIASEVYRIAEFMGGETQWLEETIHATMYYSTICEEEANECDKEEKACNGGPEIAKMLTISTAHIREETADELDSENGFHFGLAVYEKGEFGWFIHIGNVDEDMLKKMPEDLSDCIRFAMKHGCEWLCLDCDAEKEDELETYVWLCLEPQREPICNM